MSKPHFLCLLTWLVLASGGASAAELAGVSAAVRGVVELDRAQAVGRQIASGEQIFMHDSIRSGERSGMQILLRDETVFTLGANSEIVIDEFVYDPASGTGTLNAEVVKGAFRFVSGKVAKNRPSDMKVRVSSGTIGIRGTIVAGEVGTDGSALVVLLGPGRNANTLDRPGEVRVSAAGQHVDLLRPNWATRIPGRDQPPTPPFVVALHELDGLTSALNPALPPAPPPAEPLPSDNGQPPQPPPPTVETTTSGGQYAGQNTARGDVLGSLALSEIRKGDVVMDIDSVAALSPVQHTLDGITEIKQLEAIHTGFAVYNKVAASFNDGGRFDFGMVLDFGKQRGSFGMQRIVSPTLGMPPGNGVTLNILPLEFADLASGKAIFENKNPVSFTYGGTCVPCDVKVDAVVFNRDGQVAAEGAAKVEIDTGAQRIVGDTGPMPRGFNP